MAKLWGRRRLALSLMLCLVLTLFALVAWHLYAPASPAQRPADVAKAPVATARSVGHATFLFNVVDFPQAPLHLGGRIVFHWAPTTAARVKMSATPGPVAVVCTLAFFGPYASVEAAGQALDALADPGGLAFAAAPLTLTDWVASPQRVAVVLPTTLRPGYYGVIQRSQRPLDDARARSGFVVQLVA